MTDTASTTSAAPKKLDPSCRTCARLVQSILQNPESRPRQVLQSLIEGISSSSSTHEQASFQVKPVADGVKVEMRIPDTPIPFPKRWKQVALTSRPTKAPTPNAALTLLNPVLATSATTTTTTTAPNNNNMITETIQIECRPCDNFGPEQGARALIMGPTPLSIVACTNRLTPGDRDEMSQVLVHELLHAYDVKKLQLDFSDCESMAYSEVRAAREAECYTDPTRSSWQQPSFLKEYCVKQKAIAATHNLFPMRGRHCVRAVFEAAYQDTRPFSKEDLKNYVHRQEHSKYNCTTEHSSR